MLKILVLDDDKYFRDSIRLVLEPAGYEVMDTDDGFLALSWHRENAFDAALIDLLMPIKEGLETIREFHIEYPDLSLIAMSGGGSVVSIDFMPAAEVFGASATLSKPIDSEMLLSTVRGVL